jgi:3-isopropylmalate/(R)-2-methylmalate dehydratase large subunit
MGLCNRLASTHQVSELAMAPRTLYDRIWDEHLVHEAEDGTALIYIDRHLVHEVTSPQAFEGLRLAGRSVRAPDKTLAVVDHNVPTTDRSHGIDDPESASRWRRWRATPATSTSTISPRPTSARASSTSSAPSRASRLPGTTIVCGDSHTATHGAFGALAHGIGTSEVEHVLATQTLIQNKAKNMRVVVDGDLPDGVTAKDIILAIIGEIGTAGGTGHVIEYAGEAIRALSIEGRMTVCNMSIEGGARAGMVAPDEKTFEYLKGRPRRPGAPTGMPRCATGRRCGPTRAPISTARSGSTPRPCRRSSPGAPAPNRWCR